MSIPSSGRRRHRTRKTSTQYRVTAVLAAVILCAAGMVAMIVSVAGGRSDDATRSGMRIVGEGLDLASLDALVGADRPVYRHSVVAGGVYTPDELRDVLVQDAIAATHYQGLNQNAIRTETLKQDRFAYVSYRKNDQIFWTRNKVKLSEGETVLTDGNKEIRARCGNCISETPQLPVAEVEPASVEFDQLVDDSGDPFLSAAIRSALESPSFSSGGGSRRPSVVGGGSAAGASSADAGSSALLPSGSIGGGGGVGPTSLASRPTTLASRGPSVGDGAAGSPAGPEGQPGGSLSSPGSSSTGDPDSSTAYPPSVTSSTDGAADPSGQMSSALHFRRLHFHRFRLGLPGQGRRFHLVSTHHPDSIPMPELIRLQRIYLLQPLVHRMDQGTIPSPYPCRSRACCFSWAGVPPPRSCESFAAVAECSSLPRLPYRGSDTTAFLRLEGGTFDSISELSSPGLEDRAPGAPLASTGLL